uniref:Major facilitator superfamily (MFS) profile domain-containing protein n=1 Tax=Strigamia maritima TaxID=126957 RepID=T1JHA6_STRMM
MIVFVIVFNLGIGPIPWLSMSELFPAKARSAASSVATMTSWLLAFVITKTFADLQASINPYGAFWLYGSVSFVGIFLIWFFVPETKGKSPDEIQRIFINTALVYRNPRVRNQFLAAFIASIAPICAGLVVGYSSPAGPDMDKPGRRLQLEPQEKSLFSSIVNIGALFGGLLAGFLIDYFGRKLTFLITCIPYVIGWLFIVYAHSVWMLYVGRVITGVCVGITCLNTSVYITEIASPKIRGVLGSFFQLFINFGILIAYTVGSYVPWTYLAVYSAILPIIFMILMSFMPESPVWLLRNDNILGANQSLQFFRGENYDIAGEIDDLQREKQNEVKLSLKELRNPVILKPLLIIEMEMLLQQFSGINAVVFNIADIFSAAKGSLGANEQGMIVGCVMVVASIVAAFFMDRAGRRVLLLLCSVVMTLSLFTLGVFFILMSMNRNWLPVLCLVVFIFVFNLGFGPIPWLSMSELFPVKARSFASSVATATSWLVSFVITKTFQDLQDVIQQYGVFWLYGSVSFLAIILVFFFVPETKGKSQEEIQNSFK